MSEEPEGERAGKAEERPVMRVPKLIMGKALEERERMSKGAGRGCG